MKHKILAMVVCMLLVQLLPQYHILATEDNYVARYVFDMRWLIEPELEFDIVVGFHGDLAAVEIFEDDGWIHVLGYINKDQEIVIPIDFRHPAPFYSYRGAPRFTHGIGGIYCMNRGGVAFFNADGEQLTDFIFYDTHNFYYGLAATSVVYDDAMLWGFVDTNAEVAIPFRFDRAGDFSNGLASVRHDNRWGFIDTSGNIVIDFRFEPHRGWLWGDIPRFSEERASVWRESIHHPDWEENHEIPPGLWAFIDIYGNYITHYMFSDTRPFSEGFAAVRIGDDPHWSAGFTASPIWGFINHYGEIVIPITFNWANSFQQGFASVRTENGVKFINTNGDNAFDMYFYFAMSFSEERAAVRPFSGGNNNLWGFIDREGNNVIPARYVNVDAFSQGLAAAAISNEDGDTRWGFIDAYGTTVVPFYFEEVQPFQNDHAWVRQDGLWGVLQIVSRELTYVPYIPHNLDYQEEDYQEEDYAFYPAPDNTYNSQSGQDYNAENELIEENPPYDTATTLPYVVPQSPNIPENSRISILVYAAIILIGTGIAIAPKFIFAIINRRQKSPFFNALAARLTSYTIAPITKANYENFANLYLSNREFFVATQASLPRLDDILANATAVPPKYDIRGKHYLGILEEDNPIALLDVLVGYPSHETVYIGLLLIHGKKQGNAVGTTIVDAICEAAQKIDCTQIELGVISSNIKAISFWTKQGFVQTGTIETTHMDKPAVIVTMRKVI